MISFSVESEEYIIPIVDVNDNIVDNIIEDLPLLLVYSESSFYAPDEYDNDKWDLCEYEEHVTDDDDVYCEYFMKYDSDFIKYAWMIWWKNNGYPV